MNLLMDMWLLATRNITMTALCFVYGLCATKWPLTFLVMYPAWFHLSGAIMTNGDLLLKRTRARNMIWATTIVLTLFLLVVTIVKVYSEQAVGKTPDVFDYKDVLSFLFSSFAGVIYIQISVWAALPTMTFQECTDSFREVAYTKEAIKPAAGIGLLYAISITAPNADWLVSLCILASCALVLRFMLGSPPERKAKTVLKTAEGAA